MGRVAALDRRRARRIRQHAVRPGLLSLHQRRFRAPLWQYVLGGDIWTVATAPVVYALAIPFALLDASVMVFQAVCFRAWGIARVPRRAYFAIDRHRLAYLNALEKANCLYCGYANGVLGYVREVAARTEQYWCPIRHGRRIRGAHARYEAFVRYGDAPGFRQSLPALRAQLKK